MVVAVVMQVSGKIVVQNQLYSNKKTIDLVFDQFGWSQQEYHHLAG